MHACIRLQIGPTMNKDRSQLFGMDPLSFMGLMQEHGLFGPMVRAYASVYVCMWNLFFNGFHAGMRPVWACPGYVYYVRLNESVCVFLCECMCTVLLCVVPLCLWIWCWIMLFGPTMRRISAYISVCKVCMVCLGLWWACIHILVYS